MNSSPLQHLVRHARQLACSSVESDLADAALLERFLAGSEEAAFTLLVQRHGPMVFGICRRLLRSQQEAEDAFQATFLVLLRKGASIRKHEMLGAWLHQVAYRTAARMRTHRTEVPLVNIEGELPSPDADPVTLASFRELREILDEELERLPAKYRYPLILCGLQGKTHEQAGQELHWPKSSVSARLERARTILQARLSRRGITVPAGLLGGLLFAHESSAAVPAALVLSTVRLAMDVAAGHAVVGHASALAAHVINGMARSKLAVAAALGLALGLAISGIALLAYLPATPTREQDSKDMSPVLSAVGEHPDDSGWGDSSDGLRARLVAVAPCSSPKDKKGASNVVKRFAHAPDVTFEVELKNVSKKPIVLSSPQSFFIEFLDKTGKALDYPVTKELYGDFARATETLEPGKSLERLIRPAEDVYGMAFPLVAGEYQARVHYYGARPEDLRTLAISQPLAPLASIWRGDGVSGLATFSISQAPENQSRDLAWGPVQNGLQAAATYRSADETPQGWRDTAANTFPHGARLAVDLHIKNASNKDISFWSPRYRQDADKVFLVDPATGAKDQLGGGAFYTGSRDYEHWLLKPGQIAVLSGLSVGISEVGRPEEDWGHPIPAICAVKPGRYHLRHDLNFASARWTGADGQQVPGKDDWKDVLSTGPAPVSVRRRIATDGRPMFTAFIRFQSEDRKPVESGQVEVRRVDTQLPLKLEIKPGGIAVPDCPMEVFMVDEGGADFKEFRRPFTVWLKVRAPGFEETTFDEVHVGPEITSRLTLKRAEPSRLRLVGDDGKPVAEAKVSYFWPWSGEKDGVAAVSKADGSVLLDSLAKKYSGGDMAYWFEIEPPSLAPLLIGPVRAGQDLGKITLHAFLEVRGEVRGTPAELDAFEAEWEQPVTLMDDPGKPGWTYAESKPLEITRAGNKLLFHLTHLRPGTLRFISRFKRGAQGFSRGEFNRIKPTDDDVVLEIDLTKSRDDLVLTSTKRGVKKP